MLTAESRARDFPSLTGMYDLNTEADITQFLSTLERALHGP